MKMTIISALCAASLLWISTASANLISNGDFETGKFGAWKHSGDVSVTNGGPFSAAEGMDGYYAALGLKTEVDTNRLWQNFDVSGFNMVQISFDWAFEFIDAATGVNDVFISILRDYDGSSVNNITLDRLISRGNENNPRDQLLYGTYSEVIDISDFNTANARLQFRLSENFGDVYSWAGIDNVTVNNVTPVPEPATILLFCTGLVGFVAAGRRKIRK
jgi:hypothetical protein